MHPLWKGYLYFGLVSIPIKLYSALRSKELHFHLFHKEDKGKIKFARICEKDNEEVLWEDVIKGYEFEKNKYVFLEESDFEKADIHKSNSIDIIDFVNENEIDTILFEKPFFLEADIRNARPYQLLLESLKKTDKIGVAKFVLHNKEHLAIIKPYFNTLLMIQLRFSDEIISHKNFETSKKKSSEKELNIAISLIEGLSTKFNAKSYKDTYVQDLKKIILKKSKNQRVTAKGKKPGPTKNIDIAFLLRKSLKEKKKERKKIA
ncbi:MAG: Ku protein [Parachlamydiales bacterium]|jgi:DNA end-binding protein Ku